MQSQNNVALNGSV